MSKPSIYLVNGANLNLLGRREISIYGNRSFEDYFQELQKQYAERAELQYFQSNIEGELVNFLQSVGFSATGIVLNAGAYTHTSIALGDCVRAISAPVVEVHISNIYAREAFRHLSHIAPAAVGQISGLGLEGYRLAVEYLLSL